VTDTQVATHLMYVSLAMIIVCVPFVGDYLETRIIEWARRRRDLLAILGEAQVEDQIRTALVAVERKVHYRHNVHCPRCGRFAKQWQDGLVECRHHGLQLRVTAPGTAAIPIQIVVVPLNTTPIHRIV